MDERDVPPPARMLQLITGYWVSKMLRVVAELGVADALRDGPRTAADLAGQLDVDAERLGRVLRALASVGVFRSEANERFATTPLGALLESDRPDSMCDFALMMPDSHNWLAWDHLLDGVRAPETPFDQAFGKGHFAWMAEHPEQEAVFARAMASISNFENPAVADALELRSGATVVDVGGSGGHLLAAVLQRHDGVRGVLFDQPQVVERARSAAWLQGAVAARVVFEGGNFFEQVPGGADAYLMKYILHDWDDARCVRILTNCRERMAEGGQVLAVDTVIDPGDEPSWGKLLDVNMMVLTGGRERTEAEFAALFEASGLRLERVVPTACPLSIVVGRRA